MEAICNKGIAYYSIGKYEESINYQSRLSEINKIIANSPTGKLMGNIEIQNLEIKLKKFSQLKLSPNR